METRYIKAGKALYELKYRRVDEKVINLALSAQPTIASFQEFCNSVGINYELNYITEYCNRSMVMHHAVFEN